MQLHMRQPSPPSIYLEAASLSSPLSSIAAPGLKYRPDVDTVFARVRLLVFLMRRLLLLCGAPSIPGWSVSSPRMVPALDEISSGTAISFMLCSIHNELVKPRCCFSYFAKIGTSVISTCEPADIYYLPISFSSCKIGTSTIINMSDILVSTHIFPHATGQFCTHTKRIDDPVHTDFGDLRSTLPDSIDMERRSNPTSVSPRP